MQFHRIYVEKDASLLYTLLGKKTNFKLILDLF